MSKIVVALGGNALGNSPAEQLALVKEAAKAIVDMTEEDNQVIIVHGNGPQVGAIHLACNMAAKMSDNLPAMPFPECGAMSQGYIGYHLQNAIGTELKKRAMSKSTATVVTQVLVDPQDPAFQNPTKPIGPFYTKEESEQFMQQTNDTYIEDSGRGYRKVIPSPVPIRIIEIDTIAILLNADTIVIASGGGGIPVIEEGEELLGVEAVIDKDLTAECLAEELDADLLFLLTAVEKVAIDFNKPSQRNLDKMTVAEAEAWIKEGQFPPGSMLPKVQAAIKFAQSKTGRKAIISSLEKAKEAVAGETGTMIVEQV